MSIECIKDANLEETGFSYTMSLIQGKYKMFILYALMGFQVVRFNELKKYIKTISYKTLSTTLKELEADGLVHREEYSSRSHRCLHRFRIADSEIQEEQRHFRHNHNSI